MSAVNGDALVCWRCAQPLGDEPLPLARTAACRQCGADLHVCRMCRFFDRSVANSCSEPVAERVTDKERANFCGYLQLQPGLRPAAPGAQQASAELDALFGDAKPASDTPDPRRSLENLFDTDDDD